MALGASRRILFISPYSVSFVRIRTKSNLEEYVLAGANVDLICLSDEASYGEISGVNVIKQIKNWSFILRLLRIVFGLFRLKPISYQYYNSFKLKPYLKSLDIQAYDLVHIERLPIHEYGLNHQNIIFDCVDCFSDQTKKLSKTGGITSILYFIDSLLLPRYERKICSRARRVLVTTRNEKNKLIQLGVEREKIVSYIHRFQLQEVKRKEDRSRPVFGFHGKLSYRPNIQALGELNHLADLMSIDIKIAGPYSLDISHKFSALTFLGYVDSLEDFFAQIDFGIFPITTCVGIQNKVLECLSSGTPVLITNQIAESLDDLENNSDIIIVNELENFEREINCLVERYNSNIDSLSAERAHNYSTHLYVPNLFNIAFGVDR